MFTKTALAYLDWLKASYEKAQVFLDTSRGRTTKSFLIFAILACSLSFLLITFVVSWQQIQPQLRNIHRLFALAGFICALVSFLLGAIMWVGIQHAFGLRFSWQQGVSIHMLSNITKYMPGYGWQYASKAYLCRPGSDSKRQISFALLSEFILLLSGGLVLAASIAAIYGDSWLATHTIPALVWYVAAVSGFCITICWNTWAIPRLIPSNYSTMRQAWLYMAWVVGICGWLVYSASVWLFVRALYAVPAIGYYQCVFALVGAGMISIAIVIVPGGFGVRETALSLLLTGLVPLPIGVVVSLLTRISLMLAESIAFGVMFCLTKVPFSQRNDAYPKWGIPQNTPQSVLKSATNDRIVHRH